MGKADLSRTAFMNEPDVSKLVSDIYDEEAISEFLVTNVSDGIVSLSKLFPDVPTDTLSLGPSSDTLLGGQGNLNSLIESSSSVDGLRDLIRKVQSSKPPFVSLSGLMAVWGLPTISECFQAAREYLSPAKWNIVGTDYINGAINNYQELSRSLGFDCTFCSTTCGTTANQYGNNLPVNELWSAAFTLSELVDLLECRLIDQALGFVDNLSGGVISSGMLNHVMAIGAKTAALVQKVDVVLDWIDRIGDAFREEDRQNVVFATMEGYRIDSKLSVRDYENEAIRIANEIAKINPDWYYTSIENDRVLTTKYLDHASRDFVKIMSFHPEYWPIGIVEEAFDPVTIPWKEAALEDFPTLRFL